MIRNLISLLNAQANKKKYKKPFKSISWSGSENFNPDFWSEAKYYLVGAQIILMDLYSIFLETDNYYSLPLNNHFTESVNFHTSGAFGMGSKM